MFTPHRAPTLAEGMAQFKGGYWAIVVTPQWTVPVKPDGSVMAGWPTKQKDLEKAQ